MAEKPVIGLYHPTVIPGESVRPPMEPVEKNYRELTDLNKYVK